eukprot:5786274-Pleurochrysis_carterae.AAC.1
MPIECAFGILVRRFGVFWRPLAVRFDRRAKLIIPPTPAVGLPYSGWLGPLSGRLGWASRPRAIVAHPSLYPGAR